MEISIILVNYKTPELIKKCIASIKKYPPSVSYEIIVIDNSINNVGFAKANNKGIKSAKGKYILLLNSDTQVKKNSIDSLYKVATNKSDAGAVVPKLINPDGTTQPSAFRFPTLWMAIRQYWFGEKNLLDKYIPNTPTVDIAVMAAFLITPQCLKKVGLLDERYFMYFEDFDYCRRIKRADLKIYYDQESQIVHYHGASGIHLADDKNQWRRLIPGSIMYHGFIGHYVFNLVLWLGQKWQKIIGSLH